MLLHFNFQKRKTRDTDTSAEPKKNTKKNTKTKKKSKNKYDFLRFYHLGQYNSSVL